MALSINVKFDDYFMIGEAKIWVKRNSASWVKLDIEAPQDMEVKRSNHKEFSLTKVISENTVVRRRISK